jgi:hypothetical protein
MGTILRGKNLLLKGDARAAEVEVNNKNVEISKPLP